MSEKRRDNRNRILREGEYQRKDGRYRFRYIDEDGKEKNVYSWRLDKNDPMPKGKKRLTQREKAERAAIKKQLQADGVLPPDKPRLNRKKFAREVWEDFSEMDVYTADFYLRKAIMATVGPELHEVTSEQVGILKLMKLAVETDRFMQQLKKEGREQYSIGEYVEKVYNPVMNL